jgi:hypothetical protein
LRYAYPKGSKSLSILPAYISPSSGQSLNAYMVTTNARRVLLWLFAADERASAPRLRPLPLRHRRVHLHGYNLLAVHFVFRHGPHFQRRCLADGLAHNRLHFLHLQQLSRATPTSRAVSGISSRCFQVPNFHNHATFASSRGVYHVYLTPINCIVTFNVSGHRFGRYRSSIPACCSQFKIS